MIPLMPPAIILTQALARELGEDPDPLFAMDGKVSGDSQRTLRIPDDGDEYPLLPGLGSFPPRHIDEYASTLPAKWLSRGGLLLPMWQSQALWLNLDGKSR